jgi:hypothetical protein
MSLLEPLDQKHRLIDDLAIKLQKPREQIAEVFNEEYERIQSQAKIRNYVALFAGRSTRERLNTH